MNDLSRALRDMQATGSADAGPSPVGTILTRRRRRRTVRRAATGVTSAAAVTALVVSGAALLDRPTPRPPADPLTGMTEPTWLGEELPPCGTEVTSGGPAGSWLLDVDGPVRVRADEPVPVAARLAAAPGEHVAIGGAHRATALVLVDDGVVVARGVSDGPERAVEATTDAATDVTDDVELVPCGDEPLEPGTYDAWAALELRWEWGRDAEGRTAVADSAFGWVAVPVDVTLSDDEPDTDAVDVALPTGDAALEFGTCGSLLERAPEPVEDIAVGVRLERSSLPAGEPLVGEAYVEPSAGWAVVPLRGPDLVVLHEDVVVALTSLHPGEPGLDLSVNGGHGHSSHHRGTAPLAVCATDGATDRALPPGEYEVRALADVTTFDDDVAADLDLEAQDVATLRDHPDGRAATVVSDGVPLVVGPGAETPAPRPSVAVPDLPSDPAPHPAEMCGLPVPEDSGSHAFELAVDATPVTLPSDTVAMPRYGRLTYLGGGVAKAASTGVESLVLRDGITVGYAVNHGSGFASTWMSADGSMDLWPHFGVEKCGEGSHGEPLDPGRYDVVPLARVLVVRVVEDDGSTAPGTEGRSVLVVGESTTLEVLDVGAEDWTTVPRTDLPPEVALPDGDGVLVERQGPLARWRAEMPFDGDLTALRALRDEMVAAGLVRGGWSDDRGTGEYAEPWVSAVLVGERLTVAVTTRHEDDAATVEYLVTETR